MWKPFPVDGNGAAGIMEAMIVTPPTQERDQILPRTSS
jgi:hypothetical protein